MMPKNNPKDKHKEKTKHKQEEGIEDKLPSELPSDSSSQTDEDILTYQNPEEERTVESERPDGDMRK